MSRRQAELVGPDDALREAYLEYVDEIAAAGEPYHRGQRERARENFDAFVRACRRSAAGEGLIGDRVPQTHFWFVRDGRVLGTIRLRHRLNDALRNEGGHIGYDVRPSERGRGIATEMVRRVLPEARALGLRRVLLTCDKDNVASASVIRKCGGVLENETTSHETGKTVLRFWIELGPGEGPPENG